MNVKNTPNLFILGGAKCGTTTLATWLAEHPNVYFSNPKEPHYFYHYQGDGISEASYLNLFQDTKGKKEVQYFAEGSVYYLTKPAVINDILKLSPNAKFIICMRNPVEMAVSLHAQKLYAGIELVSKFEDAWALSDQRSNGNPIGLLKGIKVDSRNWAYSEVCKIGSQLEQAMTLIPDECLRVIFLDDLVNDPSRVWRETQRWLDIPFDGRTDFSNKNPATAAKSKVVNIILRYIGSIKKKLGIKKGFGIIRKLNGRNTVIKRYQAPSRELRDELTKNFIGEIKVIERLTNRDLSVWINGTKNE